MNPNVEKVRTVLLTGGTGVFGKFLIPELLKQTNIHLVLLIRAATTEEARKRVSDMIQIDKNIEVFCSDLNEPHLGLSESDYKDLSNRVTHILHAAASIRFNNSLEQARICNVTTIQQVLDFAKKCSNLTRFGFVSTALVAGNRSGLIKEDEFLHSAGFKNTYEQSKYEAESLVRSHLREMPIVIFRPPLIVTPETQTKKSGKPINLLTLSASLMARGYLPFVPGTENSTMDIVNGYDAAYNIVRLMFKPELSHITYHITQGEKALTIKVIHSMIESYIGKPVPLEFCGDMISFSKRVHDIPWYRPGLRVAYKRAATFLPEAAYPKIFDNRNTLSELGIKDIGEDPRKTLETVFNKK